MEASGFFFSYFLLPREVTANLASKWIDLLGSFKSQLHPFAHEQGPAGTEKDWANPALLQVLVWDWVFEISTSVLHHGAMPGQGVLRRRCAWSGTNSKVEQEQRYFDFR